MSTPKTLFEKIWEQHVVVEPKGEPTVLYIDLQLVHEVTSAQAFEGMRMAGRKTRCADRTVATIDHNVPTTKEGRLNIVDPISAAQIRTIRKNCEEFGIELYDIDSPKQGVVHVVGPEQGLTKPGMTASAPAKWSTCWPRRRCRNRNRRPSALTSRANCRRV